MRKRIALFLTCFLMASLAMAQTTRVTGTVISVEDGEPIPGASVLIEGTKTGVVTNADGKFTLTVPASTKHLEVSCQGMIKQRVRVKPVLNVELEIDNKALDEVMVVAYGTATKKTFTSSATVVGSEKIEALQSTNALDALTGHVAGVELYNPSGDPTNNNPTIRIYGITSLSAGTDPLIVLDGTPYGGDMNTISTQDVESMTVLKGPAATALYGARGANGVIQVTTKSGKRGNGARVTLDAKWGSNGRAQHEYKTVNNPAQYYEMYYTALNNYAQTNQGMSAAQANLWANQNLTAQNGFGLYYNVYDVPEGQLMIGTNGKLNPNAKLGNVVNYNGQDYLLVPDNWIDAVFHHGLRQEYNLNVSDATEKGSFYASVGYINNEGITYNSGMKTINARLKADYQAKKWLKVGANMAYSHYDAESSQTDEEGSTGSSANAFAYATSMAPIYPVNIRDGQGNILRDQYGMLMYDWGDGRNAGINGRPLHPGSNAVQSKQLDVDSWEGNSAHVTGFAEIRFLKDFKFTSTNSVNLDESRSTSLMNPYYGNYAGQNGILSKGHSRTLNYTFQQLLDWTHQYGRHEVGATAGHEWYRAHAYSLGATKYNMFNYDNLEMSNNAILDNQSASSYTTNYNDEAYFIRGNYNYDNKYLFMVNYRREASSRFAKEHRWGNFYSLSAAWVLTQEKFLQNQKWLNFLKLRAEYGEQGNDQIGSNRFVDTYTVANSSGNISIQPDQRGNEKITWETQRALHTGLEFGIFNDRLTGSIEYFHRKTSDMLYWFTLPQTSGYSGYWDNVGDLLNHGVAVELSADIVRQKNFRWNVGVNLTHYKNRMLSMPDEKKTLTRVSFDGKEYSGYGNVFFIAEDLSLGTFVMPVYAGVYNENTYAMTGDESYDAKKGGSSMWWKNTTDADGNATKVTTTTYSDATDYVIDDNVLPKLYGGFNTNFELYGFDLGLDFAYQIGGKVYDNDYASFMGSPLASSSTRGQSMHADLLNAWSASNTGSDIPRLQYGDQYSNGRSTRFLTKASYLSLQNLSFGYTLPSTVLRKAHIDRVRIYLNASNVWLWSKRQGLDPRTAAYGVSSRGESNASYYSIVRTISAGATITF